jgi:4a-hydroxytetrahydrobiopterin dehydratase
MQQQIDSLVSAGWQLTHDGKRIRKDWKVKNFMAGLDLFSRIAQVAEAMDHHPDLHLENYRQVWVELWTHTVGGLSDKDIELARKVDALAGSK